MLKKPLSPMTFSYTILQEYTDRVLGRMGWGTCWPGEAQCVPAKPYILAIWVRHPKWTVLFLLQANLWPLYAILPETLNSGLCREGSST